MSSISSCHVRLAPKHLYKTALQRTVSIMTTLNGIDNTTHYDLKFRLPASYTTKALTSHHRFRENFPIQAKPKCSDKKWPGLSTWSSCQSSQADKSPLQRDNVEKTIRHRSKQVQTGFTAALMPAYLLVSTLDFDLITLNSLQQKVLFTMRATGR